MLHSKVLNVPVEFNLEFAAIIGSNHLDAEWEPINKMVHKIDDVCVGSWGGGLSHDDKIHYRPQNWKLSDHDSVPDTN